MISLKDIKEEVNYLRECKKPLIQKFDMYKNFINEFYTDKDNQKNIKAIYEKCNDEEFAKEKANKINLENARSIYNEYLDGMITFFKESFDDRNEYMDKLKTALSNDKKFIPSIFGGNINMPTMESASNRVSAFEYLMDFKNDLDTLKDKYYESISFTDDQDIDFLKTALITESIEDYIHRVLTETISVYESFVEKINEKDNTNTEVPVVKEDPFKLFL